MFKLNHPPQRIIEYPIKGAEYVDLDGNLWHYNAYVQMTSHLEVRDVVLTAIEAEDINGEILSIQPSEDLKDSFRDHAAVLALERVQVADFESEDSND